MRYLLTLAGSAALTAAHGIVDSVTIDGTTYVPRRVYLLVSNLPKTVTAILLLIPVLT
jgi:hypothetical protein